jgi:hypothetical protein
MGRHGRCGDEAAHRHRQAQQEQQEQLLGSRAATASGASTRRRVSGF